MRLLSSDAIKPVPKHHIHFEEASEGRYSVCIHSSPDEKKGFFQLQIDDRPEVFKGAYACPKAASNLIDLASALYVSDRAISWKDGVRRRVHLTLPVREPNAFDAKVCEQLDRLIAWYSGGSWSFTFEQRERRRAAESQSKLFAAKGSKVALWSGGLDALAGIISVLERDPTDFHLFGTGSNYEMFGRQRELANLLDARLARPTLSWSQVLLMPKGIRKGIGVLNSTPRLRGLCFLLMGAAKALSQGRDRLFLFENGPGAINLPLAGSVGGLDHSRAVHPKSVDLASQFVSNLAGHSFSIITPFALSTKAEMCKSLTRSGLTDLIPRTISCDSKPYNSPLRHCGTCSSCVLRRQALSAAGIVDTTGYRLHFRSGDISDADASSVRAALNQIDKIDECLRSRDPWRALLKLYPTLGQEVVTYIKTSIKTSSCKDQIVSLYRRYVQEWHESPVYSEYRSLVGLPHAA
jgi:hypothetical protein